MPTQTLLMKSENRDTPANLLGPDKEGNAAWTASRNMRIVNDRIEAVMAESSIFGGALIAGDVLYARTIVSNSVIWYIYVTESGIGSYDGLHHDQTPATGWVAPDAGKISHTILNGRIVVNAPPNAPYAVEYTGFPPATIIPGWPVGAWCNAMVAYRYYLVACGIYQAGQEKLQTVIWSSAAAPGTLPTEWLPTTTNDAGDLTISELPGQILAAQILNDMVVVYKFSGVFGIQWVGGQSIMSRRTLFPVWGAMNPHAVYPFENEHIVAIAGDVVIHDGGSMRSILNGRMRAYFSSRVQSDTWTKVRLSYDAIKRELWICYGDNSTSGMTEAMVWNRDNDTITIRDIPESHWLFWTPLIVQRRAWSSAHTSWAADNSRRWGDKTQSSDSTSMIACLKNATTDRFVQMDSYSAIGSLVRANYCERVGIPLGNVAKRALITRVRPHVQGVKGGLLRVYIGAHDEVSEPVRWDSPINFYVGEAADFVSASIAGRYAAVRFESEGRFGIVGFDVDYRIQGNF